LSKYATIDRQQWMSIFARIDACALIDAWRKLDRTQNFAWLRPAETGNVMVRGRMGGSGAPFNMGEMTITRATVRLDDGTIGFGYVAGRALQKAEIAALLDAALQSDPTLAQEILPPMKAALAATQDKESRKAAATKVEFFTLVRGDNQK
jgi:alpha-D-ribose 1-methylphosphonate 5-triphosphate synthase subunit PhnG